MNLNNLFNEEKVRLDPSCWTGKKIGNPKTKVKGGVRVNNCVPAESVEEGIVEGMSGQVVFSGTGDNGSTYEIIQSGPTDFMIHANGKHIDTYGSLQRAMSVLQNEVPGLQQGMSEAIGWEPEFDKRLNKMKPDDRFNWDRANDSEYSGQPMTDFGDNWSGDRPVYAPVPPETLTLQDRITGKVNNYSFDSPEAKEFMKHRFDSELGPDYKGFVDAFKKGADFNANRPKPYTNLATSDSTNDFSDPIKLGQYDVDFPEKTVINPKNGEVTTIPSPNNPTAPFQKPVKAKVPAADAPKPDNAIVPIKQQPVTQADQKSSNKLPTKTSTPKAVPIPAKPRPGSWQELAKLNNITDPRKLQAGTYIRTPDGGEVFVNKGDTLSGLAQKMRPTGTSKRQGMKEDDGFDDITTFSDKRTTDQGGKTNQTYSSTTIAKNPTTGQQQSLASWDHTDPKTGKNYSGTSYIDPQGNAEVQKNYKESKKIKVDEVSLGDYRKKANVNKAMAQTNKFFGRDDPAKVAAADRTIAKRERGLGRADARSRPYTAPPVDKEKQRQQLTDKYPNIDELVRRAEVNRDPNYEYADGQAYYDGQEAEQKYQRLKQIQRIIQGLNEETRQATLSTPAGDFTADITKDKSTNTVSGKGNVRGVNIGAVKDMTPGGAQSVSADMDVAPGLNISATRKSADYNKGQLGGTKSVSAKYTDTAGALGKPGQQHTATRTTGIGFGGASGPRVGKNYVDQIDKTLADYMKEAKGINSIRNPNDLQPLEAGGGMGGGGGRTTSGPSPFGPKPGSREASIAQPNPNTMTVKQGPNPDYVPPKTLQQKYDDLNKKLDQLPPAPPVKTPRPGRAAADQRRTDQAQAAELKDVVPLSPAERNQLRPVDANKVRQSELNKEPPDLSNVRPGLDEESRKKREQPEVEYDDEYDDMVARVKKLAGLGPLKTAYDPKKRQYRNMPTAQQLKK